MKKNLNVFRTVVGLLGLLAAPALVAQALGQPPRNPGVEYVESALESVLIEMKPDRTGKIAQVIATPCANCPSRAFPVSTGFHFLHGDEMMPSNVWSSWNNRVGTVFYDADTEAVTRILFFPETGGDRL